MADIFISYSRADRARVRPLATRLETLGYDVWWDAELPSGAAYAAKISDEIAKAKCVLVAWSRSSCNSTWVYAETARGHDAHKLVQIALDRVTLPLPFSALQASDFTQNTEDPDAWKQLKDAIDALAAGSRPTRTVPAVFNANPVLRGSGRATLPLVALMLAVAAGALYVMSVGGASQQVVETTLRIALGAGVVFSVVSLASAASKILNVVRAGG